MYCHPPQDFKILLFTSLFYIQWQRNVVNPTTYVRDAQKSLGSLSTRDFETRTASGSELFSLITPLHTITFTMLSTFSRLWMISIKMCETPLSWHMECSLPVAARVSKTRVLNYVDLWFRDGSVNNSLKKNMNKAYEHPALKKLTVSVKE